MELKSLLVSKTKEYQNVLKFNLGNMLASSFAPTSKYKVYNFKQLP